MKPNPAIVALLCAAPALAFIASSARAADPKSKSRDSAGLGGHAAKIPVNLDPSANSPERKLEHRIRLDPVVKLGNWEYTVAKNPSPRDSVPWLLSARPTGKDAAAYQPPGSFSPDQQVAAIPMVKIPPQVWKAWFDSSMQDVVGIHYHEFVTDDLARVLITVHKVPADSPDGSPTTPTATRLEATLLTPLTFSVDQTIVVRGHPRNAAAVDERITHERGHGQVTLKILLDTLAGPQTWDPENGSGRRSTLEWLWKTGPVYRKWDTYRAGRYDLKTLRTSITLVPPTRWSKLIPVPPDKLDPREIDKFNNEIVHLDGRFNLLDGKAQSDFHAGHGSFQQATLP